MKQLISRKAVIFYIFLTQMSLVYAGHKSNPILLPAQATFCIAAQFSSTGTSSWNTISLKLTNNCGQAVDFQNAAITFKNASALNTFFWGNFSPLSYPDNNLQITSQPQSGGGYLATLNLHFPTSTDSSIVLPNGSSITLIYGAFLADYQANTVSVYLGSTPAAGEIDLTNGNSQFANVAQKYALVQLTQNNQVISSVQVPWNGTQKVPGLATGIYTISPINVTDSAGNNYIGTAMPQTITLSAGATLSAIITYTMAPPQTGKITINTRALPSQLSSYNKYPVVTLTNTSSNSSQNISVTWNSSSTVTKLKNRNRYVFSTPSIIFNGYNCTPMFNPATVIATTSSASTNLSYACVPVAQSPVTLNVQGLPATINSITITLTPNDGSQAISQVIPISNGSGSATVNLTIGGIYSLATNPISGYSVSFNPQPLSVSTNNNVEKIIFTTSSSNSVVSGWPSYLAMGAVTDDSTSVQTSLQSRPVDAIFKYAGLGGNGDPGQIIYPIFDLQTVEQSQALTRYYQQNNMTNKVMPTMVVYTAQMSGGTSFTDFEYTNLVKHYINLIMEAQKLQSYKTDAMPYPASIVLNPDLLGMVQQQNLLNSANTAISQVSINNALNTAVCFATSTIDTSYGKRLNYEQLFQAIRKQSTDNWSAMNIWDSYKMQYFNNCTTTPTVPTSINIPKFNNDFPGWAQSTNWVIRQFGANVTFGWQVNLWGVGSANWVHKNYDAATLKSTISDPTVSLINATSTYKGTYKTDFIVFDKYEMDAIPSATSIGYLFNARDWTNVLSYAKNVSESIGNIPVMLWQIPGGHLQQTNDIDPRNSHASTEPDFFFGNSYNPLNALRAYIASTPLPTSIYGTSNINTYLMMASSGSTNTYTWQISNLQKTVDSHVFAILWGGGNTTSVSSFPSDDGGWLASKIRSYYKNPVYLR